jgi:hypothetical protein
MQANSEQPRKELLCNKARYASSGALHKAFPAVFVWATLYRTDRPFIVRVATKFQRTGRSAGLLVRDTTRVRLRNRT